MARDVILAMFATLIGTLMGLSIGFHFYGKNQEQMGSAVALVKDNPEAKQTGYLDFVNLSYFAELFYKKNKVVIEEALAKSDPTFWEKLREMVPTLNPITAVGDATFKAVDRLSQAIEFFGGCLQACSNTITNAVCIVAVLLMTKCLSPVADKMVDAAGKILVMKADEKHTEKTLKLKADATKVERAAEFEYIEAKRAGDIRHYKELSNISANSPELQLTIAQELTAPVEVLRLTAPPIAPQIAQPKTDNEAEMDKALNEFHALFNKK